MNELDSINMIRCCIVEDEPLAMQGLSNYISQVEFLELVACANNPIELSKVLNEHPIDLLFLDIQMPLMNGIDFLRITKNLPFVIITTAYPSYAIEGFELDVVDYLLKPITFNRFFKAINKVSQLIQLQSKNETNLDQQATEDYFYIRCENAYQKIKYNEVLFVEAMQNYVRIHTENKIYTSLMFLKTIEESLPKENFLRVHKSYIVALNKVDNIQKHELNISGNNIPISRSLRNDIQKIILGNKLLSK